MTKQSKQRVGRSFWRHRLIRNVHQSFAMTYFVAHSRVILICLRMHFVKRVILSRCLLIVLGGFHEVLYLRVRLGVSTSPPLETTTHRVCLAVCSSTESRLIVRQRLRSRDLYLMSRKRNHWWRQLSRQRSQKQSSLPGCHQPHQ